MKKKSIKSRWLDTIDVLASNPVLLTPFIVTALLEGLAMLFIYYMPREPLKHIFNPIIQKVFGETFVHYPGSMLLFSRLLFYARMAIFVFAGAFLAGVAINMFRSAKDGRPIRIEQAFKNAAGKYASFMGYGLIAFVLVTAIKHVDMFLLKKIFRLFFGYMPGVTSEWFNLFAQIFLFFTVILAQCFIISTLPVITLKHRRLFAALGVSVRHGLRNFFTMFGLIFLPYLIYLPLTLARSTPLRLVEVTFPEINIVIAVVDTVAAVFIDCFIFLSVAAFFTENSGGGEI